MRIAILRWLAVVAACATLVAACGGEPAEDAPDTAPEDDAAAGDDAAPEDDAAAGDDAAPEVAAEPTVEVAASDLGEILVDADGATLYLFEADEGGGESTCYDECAEAWPPLEADGDPVAGSGVDETLLSTTERDDGTVQVVYGGHPLYYYAADAAAGDHNGQGVNDVWWVVSAVGEAVRDAADGDDGGPY